MARYLVDTSTLIDFAKNFEPVRSQLLDMLRSENEIGVCDVVIAELYAGARSGERAAWRRFLPSLTYWETTVEAAERAGSYRYDYALRGRAIGIGDALIAAVAVDVQATLVTNNVKDFPMADLVLMPLRPIR